MCHRFNLHASLHEIAECFRVDHVQLETLPHGDLFPFYDVPVIRCDEQGERELVACVWSLLPRFWRPSAQFPEWKKYARKYPTFNAKAETVHEKPSFRQSWRDRRALIPATSFFEHGHDFYLPDRQPFALAGLWDRCLIGATAVETCTIVTTVANELVARVHPRRRMPVLLAEAAAQQRWLDPHLTRRESLEELFQPHLAANLLSSPSNSSDR